MAVAAPVFNENGTRSYTKIWDKVLKNQGKWQFVGGLWSNEEVHAARNAFYSMLDRNFYSGCGETKFNADTGVLSVRIR